ncbi:MAG: TOBE domain-containing protein [Desulfovibrio sp.]|jgi:Molybdopterin-binding protein|nr:TOBE domain-containing protein [Desulfovibrio sp.]
MKYGVRNDLRAVVKKVKKDEVMAQAEFALEGPLGMTCVISRDSMDDLDLKPGDQVRLLVKAINVIPVKD